MYLSGMIIMKQLPKFGDKLINYWAFKDNPRREAYFVQRKMRHGLLNSGIFYENSRDLFSIVRRERGFLVRGSWFLVEKAGRNDY